MTMQYLGSVSEKTKGTFPGPAESVIQVGQRLP